VPIVVEVAGIVSAVLGALGLIGVVVVRPLRRTLADVREFLVDWRGSPARPGRPASPGVPERLAGIEDRVAGTEQELRTNGGSTLRDIATTNRQAIAKLDENLAAHVQWAEDTRRAVHEEQERVRVAGHREAEQMWRALEALAGVERGRRDGDPLAPFTDTGDTQ
jgi:hypothetical protein